MTATIECADKRNFLNLLHALFAVHDRFTHDRDTIAFRRDDGFTLFINFSLNYVSFGKDGVTEKERFWTENIAIGTMDDLLFMFLENRDDELRKFKWVVRPVASTKRRQS